MVTASGRSLSVLLYASTGLVLHAHPELAVVLLETAGQEPSLGKLWSGLNMLLFVF